MSCALSRPTVTRVIARSVTIGTEEERTSCHLSKYIGQRASYAGLFTSTPPTRKTRNKMVGLL